MHGDLGMCKCVDDTGDGTVDEPVNDWSVEGQGRCLCGVDFFWFSWPDWKPECEAVEEASLKGQKDEKEPGFTAFEEAASPNVKTPTIDCCRHE